MKLLKFEYAQPQKNSLFQSLPKSFTAVTKNYAEIIGIYAKEAYNGSFALRIPKDHQHFNKEALLELAALATELASYL